MIYAMSDIHGCIEELKNKMDQIDLRGDNRMIFLGDYIDYGESSFQVLQYIWELQKHYGEEKVIALKGNHEQMFLEWINGILTILINENSLGVVINLSRIERTKHRFDILHTDLTIDLVLQIQTFIHSNQVRLKFIEVGDRVIISLGR